MSNDLRRHVTCQFAHHSLGRIDFVEKLGKNVNCLNQQEIIQRRCIGDDNHLAVIFRNRERAASYSSADGRSSDT